MAFNIINLLGNLFELYIVNSYFSKFSTRRVSTKLFIPLCLVFTAFQFVNNSLFLTKSSVVMLGSVLFFFLVSLLYKTSMLSRIFSSIFLFILLVLGEFVVAMTVPIISGVEFNYSQTNMFLFALCTLLSKFITWSIVKVLKFNDKKHTNWLPASIALKVLPLPVATYMVVVVLFECCYKIDEFRFRVVSLISCVMLTAANILVFYLIDAQNNYAKTKEALNFAKLHIKNQISHYSELYEYQNALKVFKHDTKNKMLALSGLLNEQQNDKAIELLNSNLDFLDNQKQTIINSGNPVIDAVIQAKTNTANSLGITVAASIRLTERIAIDELELGVLIGNALDNAIEATQKVAPESDRTIHLSLITTENHLSLCVKNPVAANVDVNSLQSTKSDKANHGYGINSIRTIARKYGGEAFLSCERNVFELNVNLSNIS